MIHPSHINTRLNAPNVLRFGDKEEQNTKLSPLLACVENSPVSDTFKHRVDRAIKSLPLHIQTLLEEGGWRVVLGRFLTEIFPSLKGKTPRGWPEGSTYDQSDGVAYHSCKWIGLTEYCWASTNSQNSVSKESRNPPRIKENVPQVKRMDNVLCQCTGTGRVFRHEAGHAVNALLGNVSESRTFRNAHMADYKKLSEKDKRMMDYYIQPDEIDKTPSEAGRSEAFAEAFAALHGGGCEYVSVFRKRFKHTMAFVAQAIDKANIAKKQSA